ncbi:CST complex subunit Ten1 [Hypoxylon fragiforme]|uniref:CST complex subunit Ten1 n=1 Tax=Hypoxylon fragiforme TaxID=63214 RepID=UPI0020C5B6B2|nr:CST complex subunit Ten1 [Hypoxylon fragiforme]KAI2605847.1 CST complex subunit Ten1 [Hypoxylon fragiforme]
MSRAALPSVRCLLSNLCTRNIWDKVRFLGCVTEYSTHSATLTLQHDFPKQNNIKVGVNVTLLLESLKLEHIDIGQWVHVIGCITSIKQRPLKTTDFSTATVEVQALALWIAEDLDITSYETTLISELD